MADQFKERSAIYVGNYNEENECKEESVTDISMSVHLSSVIIVCTIIEYQSNVTKF